MITAEIPWPFEGSHGKHKMLDFPTGITVKDDRLSQYIPVYYSNPEVE